MAAPAAMVAVFGSSQSRRGDPQYADAVLCGRLLAEAGFRVATGGYGGSMEAVSRGAAEAGGTVIAVTAPLLFPERPGANEFAHIERPRPTLPTRLSGLLDESVATISLPGSIGTFTELMVAWNASFLERLGGRPVAPVVVVGELWAQLVGQIAGAVGNRELVTAVQSIEEAVATVVGAVPNPGEI